MLAEAVMGDLSMLLPGLPLDKVCINHAPMSFFDHIQPFGDRFFRGVSTSGRPSDDRRTLRFFFHAEDPSFWSFADRVVGRKTLELDLSIEHDKLDQSRARTDQDS